MEHPLEEAGRSSRNIAPCVLVIFGATGDLTGRKLAPALYNLGKDGMLPPNFACVGFARREKSHQQFREEIKEDISTYSRTKPIEDRFWDHFQEQFFYHQSDFDQDEGYKALATFLNQLDAKFATRGNRVFYLSVQPKYFPIVIEN
jgi:Glucose-6-phosphate 1-dehydrogenase